MTPEDFVTQSAGPIQRIAAVHYFDPRAKVAAESVGLDGFRFYFLGRAGVLGDAPAEVARAAFGYFEPRVMSKMWTTAKERSNLTEAVAAQLDVAYQIASETFGDIDGLADAAAAMRRMADSIDPAGLPLFAGFRALPDPTDPVHAFMHQAIIHRELRGSVHLACCAALGLPSRVAHQLRRPDLQQMFGYTDEVDITDEQHELFEQLEPMTNASMAHHAATLTSEDRQIVAATATAVSAAFDES